jgi:DNA polymerase III alpha subunit
LDSRKLKKLKNNKSLVFIKMKSIDLLELIKVPIPENPIYKERLQIELDLIQKFQFTRVFLQVQKIIEILSELKIHHIIRGSSGSSLICYLLGITKIDPIKHNLHLARFMNYARSDIPDIDIDVPYNRREEVYRRICEVWPQEVARISNHVTYGYKTALRESVKEVIKSQEYDVSTEKNKLKVIRKKKFSVEKVLESENLIEEAKEGAKILKGKTKYDSLHCGGIVIFEEEGKVPEELVLKNDSFICQIKYDKDETEDAGFIKIDILSNRGLAQWSDCRTKESLDSYLPKDNRIKELFSSGNTIGLTFGESRGMRNIFMIMKPESMEEVAIALALIRPAAANDGRKALFLKRWCSEERYNELNKPILFDDDAIERIEQLLKCDAGTADRWRKVFAKQREEHINRFKIKLHLREYNSKYINQVIDDLNQLSLYSFCKSHALSYGQLVWALAYEKVYNPHNFWVATLNHCNSMYRKWVHYREAKCSGLMLTRGKPPFSLGTKNGIPSLVSKEKTLLQSFLVEKNSDLSDFRKYGYWLSDTFFPTCYMKRNCLEIEFRGLIAIGRVLYKSNVTFITVGYDNQKYLELVIPNKKRTDLFYYSILEGKGILQKDGIIESVLIKEIKGIPLKEVQ